MPLSEPRPRRRPAWFGPSRHGWGLWPRTWQGWAVTAAVLVVIGALAYLAGR